MLRCVNDQFNTELKCFLLWWFYFDQDEIVVYMTLLKQSKCLYFCIRVLALIVQHKCILCRWNKQKPQKRWSSTGNQTCKRHSEVLCKVSRSGSVLDLGPFLSTLSEVVFKPKWISKVVLVSGKDARVEQSSLPSSWSTDISKLLFISYFTRS